MQSKDIEIFLELVSSRNITKAAEHLFVSQSVVSTRLKNLEAELGYPLFTRSKGVREIELTRQGREFVSVAVRWRNLFEESELLKDQSRHLLRLASPESVYYDFLEPVVTSMMSDYPGLKLSVVILDSAGIYDMLEESRIDFGFASYESSRPGVIHRPIYDQSFCIVSFSEFPAEDGLSPEVLDPEKEIRLSGGNFSSVSLWRESCFSGSGSARFEINSPHMMVSLLRTPGSWALLSTGTAEKMRDLYGVRIYHLSCAPEARRIYLLRREGISLSDAASVFLNLIPRSKQ